MAKKQPKHTNSKATTRREPKYADLLRGKPPGGYYRPGKSGNKQR